MGIRRAAAYTLILGALAWTSTARAADSDTERARALFDEAGELERHGQWGLAQEKVRAALRLRETPQLHYALAWALENDDKLIEAKAEYETALRLGRGPGGEEPTRLATFRLVDLERKLPVIRVRVTGPRATTHVAVDGKDVRVEDEGAVTAVNPGSHVVTIERGTQGAVEQVVYVGRSAVKTVDFDAAAAERARLSGAMRITAPDRHARAGTETPGAGTLLPWLLIGGGMIGAAGGAALLISSGTDSDHEADMQARWCAATACKGSTPTLPESGEAAAYRRAAADAGDSSTTKQTVGYILAGTSLATVAVGAVLLIRGERPSSSSSFSARLGGAALTF